MKNAATHFGLRTADGGLKDRRRAFSSIPTPRSALRSGFTLIELLLVLVILAILAGIVVPKFAGHTEDARKKAAISGISNIKTALDAFEVQAGRYPTTDEGLKALVEKPADVTDWTQHLDKVPQDPWMHDYIYRSPGTNGTSYDLFSCGPDGHEGGGDDITP